MNSQIQEILDGRVREIAHLTGVIVASRDGIAQYVSGWEDTPEDEPTVRRQIIEHRAAMTSSLADLADRVAALDEDECERLIIDKRDGWVLSGRVGTRSIIALYATKAGALGQLGYDLTLMAEQLCSPLDAEPRELSERQL